MATAAIKSEPLEDGDEHLPPIPPPEDRHHGSLAPNPAIPDDPDAVDFGVDVDDDESDPIVRTIDVCVSPYLARSLALVQFPLRPAAPPTSNPHQPQRHSHHQQQPSARTPHHPLPEAARIKPRHGLVELDFAPPRTTVDAAASLRSLPDALSGALRRRTFKSHSVPPRTHMALGRLNGDGTRLDLIPLGRVVQMRPDFSHLDEDDDEDDSVAKGASAKAKSEGGAAGKPLLFKRPESERSLALKRSSYAFKKASEEGEEWIELGVCGSRTPEFAEFNRKVPCSAPERRLKLASTGGGGGDEAYVRSLNYLTAVVGLDEDDVEGGVDMEGAEGDGGDEDREDAEALRRARALTARVASVLQRGGGSVPVPFAVLRSRFPVKEGASDDALVAAASACAVLVRGNFVLRSALLGLSDDDADARDVILLLLDRHGRVRREPLVRTFEELTADEEEGGDEMEVDGEEGGSGGGKAIIDADVINALLEGVAEPGQNSVELRVEDDAGFAARFPGAAELHRRHWERKMGRLGDFVERYEELAGLSS